MPRAANVTMNFDAHITKVFMEGEGENNTWTTSGTTLEQFAVLGGPYPVVVTFESGYELDTVTAENATISDKTNVGFSLSFRMATDVNCTITSKQSAPQPTLTFKHFFDAGTIGTGTFKFRHYSQQQPSAAAPKVSIKYTDDYVSGYIAYSLDNGATWSDYITTQTTLLTDVTQIKLKSKGLDGGIIIYKGPYGYNGESGVTTTTISPAGSDDTRPYETENITITEDTGFYYYCYYD